MTEVPQEARPIATAPKDGTMLRLLVDYTDGYHPLDDDIQAWTIGFNSLENTGGDRWQFCGWSWEQDIFTQGEGDVLGWLPFHAETPLTPAQAAGPVLLEALKRVLDRGYVSKHIGEEHDDHMMIVAAITQAEGPQA